MKPLPVEVARARLYKRSAGGVEATPNEQERARWVWVRYCTSAGNISAHHEDFCDGLWRRGLL